ncbi:unnamed protein product [Sphagnum balticum]
MYELRVTMTDAGLPPLSYTQSRGGGTSLEPIGRVIPTDLDTVGVYECTTRAPVHGNMRVAHDCTLHTKGPSFTQNSLTLTADDGVHAPVDYDVHLNVPASHCRRPQFGRTVHVPHEHASTAHADTITGRRTAVTQCQLSNTDPLAFGLSEDTVHTHLTNTDYAKTIHVFVNIVDKREQSNIKWHRRV